jgi:ligand-binding sensor domain-containing protein/AraC-like DNA-binding protein
LKKVILFFLLVSFFLGRAFALEPNVSVDNYIHRHWGSRDGLPHDIITGIVQDFRGFVWVGTDKGLARFDGSRFKIVNTRNNSELKSNSIQTLFISAVGELWIGTFGGGIVVYDPRSKRYKGYTTQNGLPSRFISSLAGDKKRNIWIGTYGRGVVCYRKRYFQIYGTEQGLSSNMVYSVFSGDSGDVWVGTADGLNLFRNGKFTVFTTKNGLRDNRIYSLHEDSYGDLWVGTARGINRLTFKKNAKGKYQIYNNVPYRLGNNYIRAILEDSNNNVWVAASNGLYRYTLKENDEYRVEKIKTLGSRKLDIPILTLYEDRSCALWMGTEGKGMNQLRNGNFKFYSTSNGLSHGHIKTIYEDDGGATWIGTDGGGLNRLKNGDVRQFTTQNGLSSNTVTAISQDSAGTLWVGTPEGLNRINHSGVVRDTFTADLRKNSVRVLYRDRKGFLWVGLDSGGLWRRDTGDFYIPYTPRSAKMLADKIIFCLAKDISDNLWIGSNEGLFCLKKDRLVPFKQKSVLAGYMILDIFIEPKGIIWLATNNGLLYFNSETGNIVSYPRESEFSSASIYRILEDKDRKLWMSSSRGLFVVSKAIFHSQTLQLTREEPVKYYHLLERDGLIASVFEGGSQPAGWKAKDGRLWFPSIEGAVVVEPQNTELSRKPLKLLIDEILVDGNPILFNIDEMSTFQPETREIEFRFSTINLDGFEDVRIKYWLSSTAGTRIPRKSGILKQNRDFIVFRDLPAGRFQLKVTAGNDDQGWNEKPLVFFFSIKYRLQLGETFFIFFVVLLALLFVLYRKLMDRRNKEREVMKVFADSRYKTSAMKQKQLKKYVKQLLVIMAEEKPFLEPDMTVSRLAERLGLPKEHVSQIINQEFYLNFNQFLNKYRVEEAKIRLLDPKERQFVVLKIAHDVGFNSKSTFNSAFKKFTGMSPSEYREKNQPEE